MTFVENNTFFYITQVKSHLI